MDANKEESMKIKEKAIECRRIISSQAAFPVWVLVFNKLVYFLISFRLLMLYFEFGRKGLGLIWNNAKRFLMESNMDPSKIEEILPGLALTINSWLAIIFFFATTATIISFLWNRDEFNYFNNVLTRVLKLLVKCIITIFQFGTLIYLFTLLEINNAPLISLVISLAVKYINKITTNFALNRYIKSIFSNSPFVVNKEWEDLVLQEKITYTKRNSDSKEDLEIGYRFRYTLIRFNVSVFMEHEQFDLEKSIKLSTGVKLQKTNQTTTENTTNTVEDQVPIEYEIMKNIENEATTNKEFYVLSAINLCRVMIEYIEFVYENNTSELSRETIINELISMNELLTNEKLSLKVFLAVLKDKTGDKEINIYMVDQLGHKAAQETWECLSCALGLEKINQTVASYGLKEKDNTVFNSIVTEDFMNEEIREASKIYWENVEVDWRLW